MAVVMSPSSSGSDYFMRRQEATLDKQTIRTGRTDRYGKPNREWRKDIPLEELINVHTFEKVTPEHVAAAQYFVREDIKVAKEVWGHSEPDSNNMDDRIRAKLVYTKEMSKMLEEYQKEITNPEYRKQQNANRVAYETKQRNIMYSNRSR
ncbi:MAG: hypothetical protein J5787_07065 [Alphaproteobacteria bacterium]|nr:hypothetical protein [Alphaproteobacteria bacterium]MBO4644030.1 hypothetical protein [Alphaproteobacteria bacterium]